jgi:hypothetical protein
MKKEATPKQKGLKSKASDENRGNFNTQGDKKKWQFRKLKIKNS